jgi:HAE1 family hydrophobic/amphiphilic exporter-1
VALATGMGSETRRPLGIAVVGGLAFSQLITLYITPVVYTYLDPINRRVERRLARDKRQQQASPQGELALPGMASARNAP